MNNSDFLQIGIYFIVLLILAKPLGTYIATVIESDCRSKRLPISWLERSIYRICNIDPLVEMNWKQYAIAVMMFNVSGVVILFLILLTQHWMPLNPEHRNAVPFALALNTSVSFVTNTNWQSYSGESTLSYFSQMVGLTVQNFLSAATGIAVMAALIRGLVRKNVATIGNFWIDLVRSTIYILLPLSILLSIVLIWQGVPQTFSPTLTTKLMEPVQQDSLTKVTTQSIPLGPVASQIAIKQLGTNGGGFYNVNSAHPFENPTPLSNFLEMLSLILIPTALCFTFGKMVGDARQGNALLLTMLVLFALFLYVGLWQEYQPNPNLVSIHGLNSTQANMEGKEVRFGVANSVLWATATTAASNGSVIAMHDSFSPLGGLVPMLLMQLGEIVFGGVGSGLYGMIVFAIVAVFIAGLMVGRTPEYLGKKIESFEMKMVSIVLLVPILVVLIGTAIAVIIPAGKAGVFNPGVHGFSEILYALSSAANNNGSSFAGLSANSNFYNYLLAFAMFIGRFMVIVPVLAIAGSMGEKKSVPAGPGTFPTTGWLFIGILSAVILIVGALSFFPALALGPIVEHYQLFR